LTVKHSVFILRRPEKRNAACLRAFLSNKK
jgi:hypothetical protein